MNYIYALKDPETNLVMYIGVTSSPRWRRYSHMNSPHGTAFKEWITQLKERGLKPDMIILDEVETRAQANELENAFIETHSLAARRAGYKLLNNAKMHSGVTRLRRKG